MMNEAVLTTENLKNKLKVEGILFKGFGHIPKFIMMDTELSLESKGIYAYFCSFAGSGDCAFPSRNKILYDLNVSKDCYYKHYNKLIEHGYLKVDQQKTIDKETGKAKLSYNTYTLIANPKKYLEKYESPTQNTKYSRVRNSGMKSFGYGTIAKAPMQDRRISLKAKGIYAYFCSFSGGGDTVFPELENIIWHLQIPKSTYYIHYRSLLTTNYITSVQRNIEGRYSINDYYINETPDEELFELKPNTENQDTDKTFENTDFLPSTENQDTDKSNDNISKKPITEKPYTQKPYTQNQDTNNTNSINTNNIYNNQSIYQEYKKENKKIEKLSKKDIFNIIQKENSVPLSICSDYNNTTTLVEILSENTRFYDEMYQTAFDIFKAALSEMLSHKELKKYGDRILSNKDILNKINSNIHIAPEYIIFKGTLVDEIVDDFCQSSIRNKIYNYKGYMKTCIANGLDTYKMKFLNIIASL